MFNTVVEMTDRLGMRFPISVGTVVYVHASLEPPHLCSVVGYRDIELI